MTKKNAKTKKSPALKVVKKPALSLPVQLPAHTHKLCVKPKKKNTPAYYHCLAETCTGKNITQACTDCKKNSQTLANLRQKEILNIKHA
jgi:hypothetical protein